MTTILRGDEQGLVPGYWEGVVPPISAIPDTAEIRGNASALERWIDRAFEDISPVFAQWSGIQGNYITDDTDVVLTALGPYLQRLSGVKNATLTAAQALRAFADAMDDLADRRNAYADKARAVVAAYREAGESKYSIQDTAQPVIQEGMNLNNEHATLYSELKSALEAIDLADFRTIGFTKFSAGHDAVESSAELEFRLLDSSGFRITADDARRLVSQVDLESLPYTYMDEHGRKWVLTDDGLMVRSGSPMDPYLNAALLTAIAQDPELHDVEVVTLDQDGNEVLTTGETIASGLGIAGTAKAVDKEVRQSRNTHRDPTQDIRLLERMGLIGNVHAVATFPASVEEAAQAETNKHQNNGLLMSDAEIDEILQAYISREASKEATIIGSEVVTGRVADALAVQTVGLSYVVVFVVDEGVARAVTYFYDEAWDMAWTEEEMLRHSGEIDSSNAFDPQEYEELLYHYDTRAEALPGDNGTYVVMNEDGEMVVIEAEGTSSEGPGNARTRPVSAE